jgi:hypothetical protein
VPDLILWYGLLGLNQNGLLGVGDSQKIMETGTIIGDKAYSVQYIVDAPRYADYLPIVQKMIDSMQITSQGIGPYGMTMGPNGAMSRQNRPKNAFYGPYAACVNPFN